MHFTTLHTSGNARVGTLTTRRGELATPFFMPDATRASVRGLTNAQLTSVGVRPMVINTYHLMLQPGAEFLAAQGGVHTLMQWDGPLLSDSGGYQVYSLIHKNSALGKITQDGATFRSVLDGSWHMLTPERAIAIQFALGSDMMVVLDDPRPPEVSRAEHEAAVSRTVRWAQQCKEVFDHICTTRGLTEETRPLLFAVVQGGPFVDLREQCAAELAAIGFDGYGFGGRHVDADGVFMKDVVAATAAAIPEDKPRFALGIGTPEDIARCHMLGWDMFDCVIPTREGRHGRVFVWQEHDAQKHLADQDFYTTFNIANAQYSTDFTPLDATCDCYACTTYTRAYLHHLTRVREPLGAQMIALHNLCFYTTLTERLRYSLKS